MQKTSKNWSIKGLEVKAMLEGMKSLRAIFGGNLELVIESDALRIVDCLNRKSEDLSKVKNIMEAIVALTLKLGRTSFKHCPR